MWLARIHTWQPEIGAPERSDVLSGRGRDTCVRLHLPMERRVRCGWEDDSWAARASLRSNWDSSSVSSVVMLEISVAMGARRPSS